MAGVGTAAYATAAYGQQGFLGAQQMPLQYAATQLQQASPALTSAEASGMQQQWPQQQGSMMVQGSVPQLQGGIMTGNVPQSQQGMPGMWSNTGMQQQQQPQQQWGGQQGMQQGNGAQPQQQWMGQQGPQGGAMPGSMQLQQGQQQQQQSWQQQQQLTGGMSQGPQGAAWQQQGAATTPQHGMGYASPQQQQQFAQPGMAMGNAPLQGGQQQSGHMGQAGQMGQVGQAVPFEQPQQQQPQAFAADGTAQVAGMGPAAVQGGLGAELGVPGVMGGPTQEPTQGPYIVQHPQQHQQQVMHLGGYALNDPQHQQQLQTAMQQAGGGYGPGIGSGSSPAGGMSLSPFLEASATPEGFVSFPPLSQIRTQQQQQQQQQQPFDPSNPAAPANLLAFDPVAVASPYFSLDPSLGPMQLDGHAGLSPEAMVCGPFYTKPIPQNVLSININKTDPLKKDHLLTNPVVRLHVLDPSTQNYLRNEVLPGMVLDNDSHAHLLEFPGRPHLVTVNNQEGPLAAVQEYIPPIQTAPYDLLRRADVRNAGMWREPLLVDESVERLVEMDALLILELLQPAITYRRYAKHIKEYDGGMHRVAWAFLKIQGPGQKPLLGNLKLQLYEYNTGFLGQHKKPPPGHSGNTPFYAFSSWQVLMASRAPSVWSGPVPKYPGTLHVSVEAVPRPPPHVTITNPYLDIRPRLPAGYGSGFEQGAKPWESLLPSLDGEGAGGLSALEGLPGWQVPTQEELSKNRFYRRLGEACEVPNALIQRLPTTACGTTAVAFSHNGVFLAGACGNPNNIFRIVLWSVLRGTVITRLQHAHNEYVYSLAWSLENDALLSCSSDGTAKVWELSHYSKSTRAIRPRVLRHACFVYAAEFHPNQRHHPYVVTGGYDGAIRLWDRASGVKIVSVKPQEEGPLAHINSLVFDTLGMRLYAGDSAGRVREYAFDAGAIKAAREEAETEDQWGRDGSEFRVATDGGEGVGMGQGEQQQPQGQQQQQQQQQQQTQDGGHHAGMEGQQQGQQPQGGREVQEWGVQQQQGQQGQGTQGQQGQGMQGVAVQGHQQGQQQGQSYGHQQGQQQHMQRPGPVAEADDGHTALSFHSEGRVEVVQPGPSGGGGTNGGTAVGTGGADGAGGAGGTSGAGSTGGGAAGMHGTAGGTTAKRQQYDDHDHPEGAPWRPRASEMILRALRGCDEFEGEPICSLFLHPNGRRLGVLTRGHRSSRYSRLSCVDTKTLQVTTEYLGGLRCKRTPIKASFSPDGNYVLCGSEDGCCYLWDADGGSPVQLPPCYSLQGEPVLCTAWNKILNVAAVCGYSSWSPVRLLGYERGQPPCLLPLRRSLGQAAAPEERKKANRQYRKYELPDRLTPELVRGLLEDIRTDAVKRKLIRDPVEEKLVVRKGSVPPLEDLHSADSDGRGGHGGGRQQQQQQQQQQEQEQPMGPEQRQTVEEVLKLWKGHGHQQPTAGGEGKRGPAGAAGGRGEQEGAEGMGTIGEGDEGATYRADEGPGKPVVRYHPFGKDAPPAIEDAGPLPPEAVSEAARRLAAGALAPKTRKEEDEAAVPPARYAPSTQLAEAAVPPPGSLTDSEKLLLQKDGGVGGAAPAARPVPLPPPPPGLPSDGLFADGPNKHGFTDEEVARLAAQGGAVVVAGPESMVLAGAGSTVLLRPGAAIIDAGAVKAQRQAHEAAAAAPKAEAEGRGKAGQGQYEINLERLLSERQQGIVGEAATELLRKKQAAAAAAGAGGEAGKDVKAGGEVAKGAGAEAGAGGKAAMGAAGVERSLGAEPASSGAGLKGAVAAATTPTKDAAGVVATAHGAQPAVHLGSAPVSAPPPASSSSSAALAAARDAAGKGPAVATALHVGSAPASPLAAAAKDGDGKGPAEAAAAGEAKGAPAEPGTSQGPVKGAMEAVATKEVKSVMHVGSASVHESGGGGGGSAAAVGGTAKPTDVGSGSGRETPGSGGGSGATTPVRTAAGK